MPKNSLKTAYAMAKLREPLPPPPVDYRTLAALANEVPQPYTGGNTRNALPASQWINNLAIGLGYGGQNQLAGIEQTIRHPIDTAKALFQAVTHPVRTANALAGYVKQGVTSGPMGLGQLIGENIGLPRHRTPVMREMTAYHGSPHDFDAFDMSKIGTGEGAQAYGHGLYFAENPAVARTYTNVGKDQLTFGRAVSGDFEKNIKGYMEAQLGTGGASLDQAKEITMDWVRRNYPSKTDSAKSLLDSANFKKGALYNVDIPDEAIANMLDWDAPLSQQPHIMRALENAGIPAISKNSAGWNGAPDGMWERGIGNKSGEWLYREITNNNAKEASSLLNKIGIPGIKYYDGGSRGAGQGTRNFVVFDDKLPKILKKE